MKKKKNEAAAANPETEVKKEPADGNEAPAEKAAEELPFRKVIYGYDPEEVAAFIEEMNGAHLSSLKLHESKLSALKDELVLSNRERDCYIERCREFGAASSETARGADEAELSQLRELIDALEEENESLRKKKSPASEESTRELSRRIAELEARNVELEELISSAEKEKSALLKRIGGLEETEKEYKSALLRAENAERRAASLEKEAQARLAELDEKEKTAAELTAERDGLLKKLSEAEVAGDILTRRSEEYEAEITQLKENNRAMALENADKFSALEGEYAQYRLEAKKKLKLYGYYVDRAEITVEELTKQLKQIRESVEE